MTLVRGSGRSRRTVRVGRTSARSSALALAASGTVGGDQARDAIDDDRPMTTAGTEPPPARTDGPPEEIDLTGRGAFAESTRSYVRSPRDVLRFVVFAVSSLVLIAVTIGLEDGVVGIEEDIVELFGFISPTVERVLHGTVEVTAALIALAALLLPLVTRRTRLFGYVALASITALGLMSLVQRIVDRETSPGVINELADRAGITESGTSSGSIGLAQLTAMFIVMAPFTTRRWRRAGALCITVLVIARVLVSVRLPIDVFLAVPLGAVCGTAVLLALGRPDRRPTDRGICDALAESGLAVVELRPADVDARGSTPYVARLDDGGSVFVKVMGSDERAADLMYRAYRFVRFKNIGDERLFSSLRRTLEHEALVALLARDVGVRTPRIRSIVDVGADSMLLAYDLIDGRPLDDVPDADVTDDVVRQIWEQVAVLRCHRIAHRDLRRSNVLVATDGAPWLIDFGFSEVAVAPTILDADVAQLLVSLALVVGPNRAVDSAIDVLGADAVAEALPRLQTKALSSATQDALKQRDGLVTAVRERVVQRTGVGDVELVELDRASRSTLITMAALVAATYFLFPQLADLPGIVDQVGEADWAWTPLIALCSAATYVAAAMSLAGSVPDRMPGGPMFLASVGSSFAGTLAPASVGGVALNLRFFQKQGVERPVAVSGVGLDVVGGVIGHAGLIGVFFLWAGSDAFDSLSLPDPQWFLIGLGVVAALGLLTIAVPATRQLLRERLLATVVRAFDGVADVLRSPGKVSLLLGGSVLVTFFYLLTCWFSIEAFGGGLPFSTVGAVFLVALAIATAAPTPGGLGTMEAALIAGLVSAGLDNTVAVPAVFLYRLFTFWIPILPGWFAFRWLQRHDYL